MLNETIRAAINAWSARLKRSAATILNVFFNWKTILCTYFPVNFFKFALLHFTQFLDQVLTEHMALLGI